MGMAIFRNALLILLNTNVSVTGFKSTDSQLLCLSSRGRKETKSAELCS